MADPDIALDADCPLDLSDWEPSNIIERWENAFLRANGVLPNPMLYERGWFVIRTEGGWLQSRDRRKSVAAMIWRLENRPAFGRSQ